MKKFIYVSPLLWMILMFMISECTSTKKSKTAVPNYIGQWNFVLNGPDGELNGILRFSQVEDQTHGAVETDQEDVEFSKLLIDEEKVSGNFVYMGYTVYLEGLFEGDVLKGKMSAEGYEFPFEAKKQSQN